MNPVARWFHQLGSPPYFNAFAARWAPWCHGVGALVMAWGLYAALYRVPADYQQGDSFRILYIHVPAAWMSLLVFALMALYAAIALVWRIKICESLAMACAPIGAAFTVVTLLTGSIWGKPMWGTWWDWDPRLTTELILLFLYLGVIGLYGAIEDRRAAARAASLLALVGVVMLPIIRYSVVWWNSLHQGQTIRLLGESSMDASMLPPLIWMLV
ncbi:MAG TPA: heme ABC transporter permease CcmC, partial [Luteimonas sp.]|nr:heme ABC transporter permease CcmC [Luteimonas sp.]